MSFFYQYGTVKPIHGFAHARRHRVFRFIQVYVSETKGFLRAGEWADLSARYPHNFKRYSRKNPRPENEQ